MSRGEHDCWRGPFSLAEESDVAPEDSRTSKIGDVDYQRSICGDFKMTGSNLEILENRELEMEIRENGGVEIQKQRGLELEI